MEAFTRPVAAGHMPVLAGLPSTRRLRRGTDAILGIVERSADRGFDNLDASRLCRDRPNRMARPRPEGRGRSVPFSHLTLSPDLMMRSGLAFRSLSVQQRHRPPLAKFLLRLARVAPENGPVLT